jgi:UDP-N-acetylmuramate--alanine ligase
MDEFASCFNDADTVYIAPVYAAGEQPIEGASAADLVRKIKDRGHRAAYQVTDATELAELLAGQVREGDMVVCLGAGDITKWAAGLADAIRGQQG